MMSHSSFFSPRSGRWLSVTEILLMGGFKPQLSPSFIVLIEICWGGGGGGGGGCRQDEAKAFCILHHRGVQLTLAYS